MRPQDLTGKLYFMTFDDESQHWMAARDDWAESTCGRKIRESSLVTELSTRGTPKAHEVYKVNVREHVRPRFWYYAFVACDMELSEQMIYNVHLMNSEAGWQKE